MKVFVWNYVSKVSDSYHEGGGLVVFASDETRARELANSIPGVALRVEEAPDEVRFVEGDKEAFFVMPDAGCC